MRRVRAALPALADVALVLAALLAGAGVGHRLLLPARERLTLRPGLFLSGGQTPGTTTSSGDDAPAPGDRAAHRVPPRTALPPAQRLAARLAAHARRADWRQDLQQRATWSPAGEAPAGAGRYPSAVPAARQRDDRPHPAP